MIRKYIVTTTLALACGGAMVAAQQGQRPATPTATTPVVAGSRASMTFVGCLYMESQIPGRTPNVAERAGVREDYILANATMGSAASSTRPGATPGAAGTSGTTARANGMYKIESVPDEQLKALVGKRVEVMGKVDPEGDTPAGAASPNRSLGGDAISLAEIEATSIHEVSGTCPAVPAAPPAGAHVPNQANPGANPR